MLLDFKKTKELLTDYDLPLAETKSVSSFKQVSKFIEKNGYPIVFKIYSPEVLHRTERNLVKTDIKSKEELKDTFNEFKDKTEEIDSSKIIIQKQEEGIELVYGMKRDEIFGPVLMFGLGGIFVEILEDVSFGITPVNPKEAKRMIEDIKAVKVLKGFRNYPSVDLGKAADLLVKLSDLVEQEEIEGVDFNPVIAKQKKFKIVDPKIIL